MVVTKHRHFVCDCCGDSFSTEKAARKCAYSHISEEKFGICTICGSRLSERTTACCTVENLAERLTNLEAKKVWKGGSEMLSYWNECYSSQHAVLFKCLKKAQEEENGL
jgi:hypothetical protein